MLHSFSQILLYILTGIALMVGMLLLSRLIRPHRPNPEKLSTYESGEDPEGNANIQFNLRFYVVALVFVLFEAELLFLFPWATVFANKALNAETNGDWALFALIEMFIFVGILSLGLAYVWRKGFLDWEKPQPEARVLMGKVPPHLYQKINQKYQSHVTTRENP